MKHLFHITLLLMLSLSISVFGDDLSTIKAGVKIGKVLSPTFVEGVMNDIKEIEKECTRSVSQTEKLLKELKELTAYKKRAKDAKGVVLNIVDSRPILKKESILRNRNRVLASALTDQIEKFQGMKQLYQSRPICELDKLSFLFPGYFKFINSVLGQYSPQYQFNFAINYLTIIRDKIKNRKPSSLKTGISKEEIDSYKFCSFQLKRVIEEFDNEKK